MAMRSARREGTRRSTTTRRLALTWGVLLLAACSGGTDPGGGGGTEYDHGRAPGASARDLLTAGDYDRLVVQVQYVQGFEPTAQGLQHLEDFLEARLNKPAGITIQVDPTPIPVQSQATYADADVRAIEQQHRTTYSEGSTLATYLLFVDGEYEGEANVLGIAYNNTSMAIFEETIHENTGGGPLQPSAATVEGTVANHEFGHILGLVNNGTDMQDPHQDVPNGRHCDEEGCLMHFAVRTTNYLDNLLGGSIPPLDANCLADLQANGGK